MASERTMPKMTKREAVRWIKREVAAELRQRVAEVPDRIADAPDPKLVESLWQQTVWDVADRVAPENTE